jgi:hypothetical protein
MYRHCQRNHQFFLFFFFFFFDESKKYEPLRQICEFFGSKDSLLFLISKNHVFSFFLVSFAARARHGYGFCHHRQICSCFFLRKAFCIHTASLAVYKLGQNPRSKLFQGNDAVLGQKRAARPHTIFAAHRHFVMCCSSASIKLPRSNNDKHMIELTRKLTNRNCKILLQRLSRRI